MSPASTTTGLEGAGAMEAPMHPQPGPPTVSYAPGEPDQTAGGLTDDPEPAATSDGAINPQEQTMPEPVEDNADAAVVTEKDQYNAPPPPLASAAAEPFPQLFPEAQPGPAINSWNTPLSADAPSGPSMDEIRQYNMLEAQTEHAEVELAGAELAETELAEAELADGNPHLVNEQRMSAFARLKFEDGYYYMHTYAIELGRDTERYRNEVEQKREQRRQKHRRQPNGHATGNTETGSSKTNRKRKRDYTMGSRPHSVVSETGGIVRVPAHEIPMQFQRRRASEASQSISSSSHHHSQGHSSSIPDEDGNDYAPHAVMIGTLPEVPLDLQDHVPDPNSCPLVPIHPSSNHGLHTLGHGKGISRRHAKISYNFETGQFDLTITGQNGVFLNSQIYHAGRTLPLENDDHLQIGQVSFYFQLPSTDEEVCSNSMEGRSSRGMSFAFENGQGQYEEIDMSSDEEESESIDPRSILYRAGYRSDDSVDVVEDQEAEEEGDGEEDDDDTMEDEPPKKRMKKQTRKQVLKLKMAQKAPLKYAKHMQKSKKKAKPQRLPSPSPPPPPPKLSIKKQQKMKQKEPAKEPPKDKSKTPVKDLPKEKTKEKSSDLPKPSDKESQNKKEPTEQSNDQLSAGTILTAEICAKYSLPETMIGQAYKPRKGPGRPPKDGFMSKREKAQLTRQAKEVEKAKKLGIDPKEYEQQMLLKAKAGRAQREGKDDDDVKESVEGHTKTGASDQNTDKKPAKSSKPPRSPSPVMKEEDYSEEQLQRPQVNYVVMIHEAITGSKTGSLNLQQIYSAIERKYPFYKFRVPTNGWQSSVRHNLGQHDAFKKGEKEGKGYNWVIDPSISIEKERRKRATPPPQTQPQTPYYNNPAQYPMINHQGAQPQYYGGYPPYPPPPHSAPPDAARVGTPNSKEAQPSGPRLPPSLARSNAPANVPTTQGASTYASPWGAGGDSASRPPTTQGGHPYPPATQGGHVYSPYGPPRQPVPPTTQGGTYGMLVSTPPNPQAYTTSAPYQHTYPATSYAQLHSDAQRTYSPYATAGPPQASPYSRPPPADPRTQFRYPPNVTPSTAEVLDAFRNRFVLDSADKAFAERKVDNAIRQVVSPGSVTSPLTEPEHQLVKVIHNLLPNNTPRLSSQAQNQTTGTAETSGEQKGQVQGPPTGRTLSELATSAATAAASDAAAAVAADAKPAVPASASLTQLSTPPASNRSDDAKVPPKTPTAEEKNDTARPSSSSAKTQRPSVEPLTPVPGSPMVLNQTPRPSSSAGTKRAFREVGQDDDGVAEEGSATKKQAV